MPHIALPEGLPGIRGAMAFRPETAKPLNELVEILLCGSHSLSPGERELIATYVSSLNDCHYCQSIHGAIAAAHLNDNEDLVRRVKADFQHADISDKLKALLVIAAKVQKGGKNVTEDDIAGARSQGATDLFTSGRLRSLSTRARTYFSYRHHRRNDCRSGHGLRVRPDALHAQALFWYALIFNYVWLGLHRVRYRWSSRSFNLRSHLRHYRLVHPHTFVVLRIHSRSRCLHVGIARVSLRYA